MGEYAGWVGNNVRNRWSRENLDTPKFRKIVKPKYPCDVLHSKREETGGNGRKGEERGGKDTIKVK